MINIQIKGLDKVRKKLGSAAGQLDHALTGAGTEAGNKIINQPGLRRYPPAGAGNKPPVPYYIRGRGTQTASGNLGNSQRLGTQWNIKPIKGGARVDNKVTYAKFVHGNDQSLTMKRIGWRKLKDVAEDNLGIIKSIFLKHIRNLMRANGIK